MAVDFHARDGRKRGPLLFQLPQNDYDRLEHAFAELARRTGVLVDPYGSTRLDLRHVSTLAGLVAGDHPAFGAFLGACAAKGRGLIVEGD